MDILGERIGVKTATREGPFNLQCKYLSISGERGSEEGGGVGMEGQWGGHNSGVFQSSSFFVVVV